MNDELKPMCTMMPGSKRAAAWLQVFGRLTDIPITSWLPVWAVLPGRGRSEIYLLDLARVTFEERARLVSWIAGEFGLDPQDVSEHLARESCPVLAEDVAVAIPLRLLL